MTQRKARLTGTPHRPTPWGDHPPRDDDEARTRLLDAAERCYERRGVARTTVDDIAKEAAVHRTTVYRYFGTHDDVLAFVMLRETTTVIELAETALGHSPRAPPLRIDRRRRIIPSRGRAVQRTRNVSDRPHRHSA